MHSISLWLADCDDLSNLNIKFFSFLLLFCLWSGKIAASNHFTFEKFVSTLVLSFYRILFIIEKKLMNLYYSKRTQTKFILLKMFRSLYSTFSSRLHWNRVKVGEKNGSVLFPFFYFISKNVSSSASERMYDPSFMQFSTHPWARLSFINHWINKNAFAL